MLQGVTLELVRRGYVVSVLARRADRLRALAQAARDLGGPVCPLAVDYRDTAALMRALERAVGDGGAISLAVVWVHRVAPEAPWAIARYVGTAARPGHYFHVLGSATEDPSQPDRDCQTGSFRFFPNLRYHEVILGFVREPWGSRWLTDEEICRGVLTAIDRRSSRWIVGTVAPWSEHP